MKQVSISAHDLAQYLRHNLIMSGYDTDYEELLLIADMIIDFLAMTTDVNYVLH